MIQVVTAVRCVLVQCLSPKGLIGCTQFKVFFSLGGVRNVGSSILHAVEQHRPIIGLCLPVKFLSAVSVHRNTFWY